MTLAAAVAGGCALFPPTDPGPVLAAPATLGAARAAERRLVLEAAGGTVTLQAFLHVDADTFRVIGLNALGLRLLDASVAADGTVTGDAGPAGDATRLLTELQWMAWPLDALQAADRTPWTVREPAPDRREILRDGEPVATVTYDEGTAPEAAWSGRARLERVGGGRLILAGAD